jgi:hypothetical protein
VEQRSAPSAHSIATGIQSPFCWIAILGLLFPNEPTDFRAGQTSVFKLLGDGDDTLELLHDVDFSYSGVLPKTGDYFITVKRSPEAKGTSRYRLTVALR